MNYCAWLRAVLVETVVEFIYIFVAGKVWFMALRQKFGWSEGDLMRSDCKSCSRLMRQTAGIWSFGGGIGFWILCRLHYGLFLHLLCYCFVLLLFSIRLANQFCDVFESRKTLLKLRLQLQGFTSRWIWIQIFFITLCCLFLDMISRWPQKPYQP